MPMKIRRSHFVSLEIAYAVEQGKRIIPVAADKFAFPPPDDFPGSLTGLPRFQAVVSSCQYFKASIDKLVDYFSQVQH